MGEGRPVRAAVAAVASVALLVVVLAGLAATTGSGGTLTGDGPGRLPMPSSATESEEPEESGSPPPEEPLPTPSARATATFRAVAIVVELLLAGAAAWLLLRALRRARERWRDRDRREVAPEVDFDVVGAPARLAAGLSADAAAHRDLLVAGEPGNAVVAAWMRFEETAAAIGARRDPWETSSEFTVRLLDAVDAPADEVARLGELYRAARFSDHPLTEADRTAALAALDAIHQRLGTAGAR